MKTHVASLALVAAVIALPALAIGTGAAGAGVRQLYREFRDLESQSHQGRIRILQAADSCIRAAETRRAFRACEEQERADRQALRAELQPRKEALKARVTELRPQHGSRSLVD